MKNTAIEEIRSTLKKLDYDIDNININVSVPKNKKFGDLSTNIAFIISKKINLPTMEVATIISNKLESSNIFKEINIAEPGFINFTINPSAIVNNIKDIIDNGSNYGKNTSFENKTVLVEFVSANPTGPLTVGHGRGAILGDILSNIFEWNGYKVTREYYYNNAGRQMRMLGESVKSRYFEILNKKVGFPFPENGYQGDYIKDIAKEIINTDSNIDIDEVDIFKDVAEKYIFKDINNTLKNLGITFDLFFNENTLYENKSIYKVIDKLRSKKLIYEKDGATWFEGTKVGRENDRVLIKKTGEPTYRLPDMAYHINKLDREYDLCVDIFGADHMDAYPDVLEVVKQLDYDQSRIKVLIHQFISILKNNKQVKMSTRKATYITLDELIDEVGSDVVRYFFIMRSLNSHLNFDLDIAKEKSEKNPVYYIQYAHARICAILNKNNINTEKANLNLLNSEDDIAIINNLINFEEIVLKLKDNLEPQILSNYLYDLATKFHKYYAHNRVINDDDDELTKARLVLIKAVKIIINNGLNILGITSPKSM